MIIDVALIHDVAQVICQNKSNKFECLNKAYTQVTYECSSVYINVS